MDNKLEELVDLINTLKPKGLNIEVEPDTVISDEELEELIDVLKEHFKMKEER